MNIAVFLSGRGSNFVALFDATQRGELCASIQLVVSDKPDCRGVVEARARGIDVVCVSYASGRGTAEAQIDSAVPAGMPIALAGYMRVLSPEFVARRAGLIVNIHPSLLPAFKGAHAIRDAWDAGVSKTGVTVHIVTEELDGGPIIAQKSVSRGDTIDILEERIHATEHSLYPAALENWLKTIK